MTSFIDKPPLIISGGKNSKLVSLLGLILTLACVSGQLKEYSPTAPNFNGAFQELPNGFNSPVLFGNGNSYSSLKIFREGTIVLSDDGFPAVPSDLGRGGYAQISPFFTEETQTTGNVFYELNDPTICFSVSTDDDFICEVGHRITWVGRQLASASFGDFDYQVVIASSSTSTYVMFNYDTASFSTLTGTVGAGSGFDFMISTGELDTYSFSSAGKLGAIPLSETMFDEYGNYQMVGRFVFEVSGAQPVEAAYICVATGIFYTSPSVGSVAGGTAIGAVGPCIDDLVDVICLFGTMRVTPSNVFGNTVTCVSPKFGCTSTVDFNILINDAGDHRTTFSIVAPEDSDNGIWRTLDSNYTFGWNVPESESVAIAIVAYDPPVTDDEPLGSTKSEVALSLDGNGVENTKDINLMETLLSLAEADPAVGQAILDMPDMFLLCVYDSLGEFSFSNPIYPLQEGYKEAIYNLLNPNNDYIRDYWEPRAYNMCKNFIDNFNDHELGGAIPAPCYQVQAEYDIRFRRVPDSNRPCYASIVQGKGQQTACYGPDGNIICGEGRGLEAIYNHDGFCENGGVKSRWQFDYAKYDVNMKEYCCTNRKNTEQCAQYNKLILTDGCRGYNPYLRLGQATGFGQIFTLDGLVYTLACEGTKLVYSYATNEVMIHANYKQINDIWATCETCPSVYMYEVRIQNGNTIFFMSISDVTNEINVFHNGIPLEIGKEQYASRIIEDFTMVVEHFDGEELGDDGASWKIRLIFKDKIAIEIQMYGDTPYMLSVRVQTLEDTPLATEGGMLAYVNVPNDGGIEVGTVEDKVITTSYFCVADDDQFSGEFTAKTCESLSCPTYAFTTINNAETGNQDVPFNPSVPSVCFGYSSCVNEYYVLLYSNPSFSADIDDRADRMIAYVNEFIDYRAKRQEWVLTDYKTSCNCPPRALGSEVRLVGPFEGFVANYSCVVGFYSVTELEVSVCSNIAGEQAWSTFTLPVCIFCSLECVNGVCVGDQSGNEACVCDENWVGPLCDTTCNLACDRGTCMIRDPETNPVPYCECEQGWTGDFCDEELTCLLECGNGECVTRTDGAGEPLDECVCDAEWWQGELCDELVCNDPVCSENGVCDIDDGQDDEPYCRCNEGWSGDDCTTPVCDPTCVNGICEHNEGTGISCNCDVGWEGDACDIPICDPACIEDQGICEENTLTGDHQCRCFMPWSGVDCGDVDDCTNNGQCVSGACMVKEGLPYCECLEGYTGEFCETLIVSTCDYCKPEGSLRCIETTQECECKCGWMDDSCSTQPTPCSFEGCKNGGTCNIINSVNRCCCPPRYSGNMCEIDLLVCGDSYCNDNGECTVNMNGQKECDCKDGYTGETCDTRVEECPEDYCNGNGQCSLTSTTGDYKCDCSDGYTGERCDVQINNCGTFNCENGGICENYACVCSEGYTGPYCGTQVNDCGTIQCLNGGTCLYENYMCMCKLGYTGNQCETSITSCGSLTCLNGGVCGMEDNRYKCFCRSGYYGMNCQIEINSCQDMDCNFGVCQFIDNVYKCICKPGFYGDFCENFNGNCPNHQNPCKNGGSCYTYGQTTVCYCPPGYTGSICERDVNECESSQNNPCRNGQCMNRFGDFFCQCDKGYAGRLCDVPVNICSTNPCRNGGLCNLSFTNNNNDNYDTTGNAEYGIGEAPRGYTCTCPIRWTGKDCEMDVDECKIPYQTPCQNGGKCTNYPGDYKCDCTYKFFGKNCESLFYQCNPTVCANGGRCEESPTGYKCWCTAGYSGTNCQQAMDPCREVECRNGGVCVNNDGLAKCVCGKGFGGSRCEERVDGTENMIMIALLIVLGVFILFGVAVLICCCWRNTCRVQEEDDCKEVEEEVTTCIEPWNFSNPMITHHVPSYGTYTYRPGNEIYVQKEC